jgi:hypothetical protein
MLNRRILRIKAFKVLYSNAIAENMSLAQAQSQLDVACEATRDLYIYMLGIVSPLTKIARERIESAKAKFNPSEEDINPNMKFADNALAKMLDADVDFQKILTKKKLSWDQYDIFLKKVMNSVASKEYFSEYMASPVTSLKEDCRLFTRIFEEEFVDSEDLEKILEDMVRPVRMLVHTALIMGCQQIFAGGKQRDDGKNDHQVLERRGRFHDHVSCDREQQDLDQRARRMHAEHLDELDRHGQRQAELQKVMDRCHLREDHRRLDHDRPADHQDQYHDQVDCQDDLHKFRHPEHQFFKYVCHSYPFHPDVIGSAAD